MTPANPIRGLEAWIEQSTKASGVPKRVKNKKVLQEVAERLWQ